MTRLLPYPFLALSLLVMWLLLNQSLSPGHIALGAAVAVMASRSMAALRPQPVRIRSVRPIPRLAGIILYDIIRSNIAVARIVLSGRQRGQVSGFVRLPLDMRNRYGLTVLALVITATPGTIWAQFDRANGSLLVHVLDLIDEEEWISLIKGRYERLLMEIFE